MILLCEDGSLRIYMANVENTSYWLQPSLQPSSVISIMKPVRKRKTATISKALPPPSRARGGDSGQMVMVPVSSGAGPSSVLRVCTSRAGGVSSVSGRLRSQMPCGMTEERNGDCLACVAHKGRAGAG